MLLYISKHKVQEPISSFTYGTIKVHCQVGIYKMENYIPKCMTIKYF